jgi:hypothetical protein
MTDREADDDKVFAETNVDTPHNENLAASKSTKVHPEEAQLEKDTAKQQRVHCDRQPDEIKARADILPEDARLKSKQSEEELSG